MTTARRHLVGVLAAATLIVTAAPGGTPPDLGEYEWLPMVGAESAPIANGDIYAITVVGDDIYVGGSFTDFAGIAAADRIARWSGADEEWQALEAASTANGSIISGTVKAIEVSGYNVYVGGDFWITDFYANARANLALYAMDREKWYGFSGAPSNDAVSNGEVRTIFADEISGALYVGGTFTNGADNPNADYLMIGSYNACVGSVSGACPISFPDVTVCAGVSIPCGIDVPNNWSPAGDDGASGPALGEFVSSVSAHPDGGVIVSGNFGAAGGVTGANSLAHFEGPFTSPQVWNAQTGVPSVTMYPTANAEGGLFVAGWEGLYQRTSGTTWEERCAPSLHISGLQWTSLAVASSSLVFVGSASAGISACNPQSDGATAVSGSGPVNALAMYNGALIVSGGVDIGGLDNADYLARYAPALPATNSNGRRTTDTMILLATLTALTALAGTQLLRRA